MIFFIKRQIDKVLSSFGFDNLPFRESNKSNLRLNVFNSTFQKKVLLSYISSVFNKDNSIKNHHTNFYKTYLFAEVLNELGYAVDVVDWTEVFNGDYNRYDAIIGLGESVEEAFKHVKKPTKIIWFGTGCNPFYSNPVTVNRVIDFHNKHGLYLIESSRFIYKDWPLQHEAADWIILHGNCFSKSTFRKNNIDVVKAPVYINHKSDFENKNWVNAKSNYLWFGSSGLIHKGLDLLIDTFTNRDDINLHICGNLESEKNFYNYYKKTINKCSNIYYHGEIDIKSLNYKNILENCAFVIFPSASEGGAASVITCMANGGLIPITTKSADVDLTEYGIEIYQLSVEGIEDAISRSQELDTRDLINQSKLIIENTSKKHTFECFKKNIHDILKRILN